MKHRPIGWLRTHRHAQVNWLGVVDELVDQEDRGELAIRLQILGEHALARPKDPGSPTHLAELHSLAHSPQSCCA
jgi:hypothetical protein